MGIKESKIRGENTNWGGKSQEKNKGGTMKEWKSSQSSRGTKKVGGKDVQEG